VRWGRITDLPITALNPAYPLPSGATADAPTLFRTPPGAVNTGDVSRSIRKTRVSDQSAEIARLRAQAVLFRTERDACRADVDRTRAGHVASTTTEPQLLSARLVKDIKDGRRPGGIKVRSLGPSTQTEATSCRIHRNSPN
jgi:hypothetical protein